MLLLVVLAFVPIVLWLGIRLNQAKAQEQAVKVLRSRGHPVIYNWTYDPHEVQRRSHADWRGIGRRILGDDFFDAITYHSSASQELDESDLIYIAKLKDIEILDLSDTPISNSDILLLQPLESLRVLGLRECGISDEAVEALVSFRALRRLDIRETRVSKNGADQLKETLSECEVLR